MGIQGIAFTGIRNYANPAQRKQPYGFEGKYFAGTLSNVPTQASADSIHFGGNHPYKKNGISLAGWFRKTPEQKFFKAVEKNNVAGVEAYLANGGDINHKDTWGLTALMLAVACNHADMAKLLVEKGANKNLHDSNGLTALHFVTESPRTFSAQTRVELVDLLATPENINWTDYYRNQTALFKSIKNGLDETSLALIAKGADVTIADKEKMTTLMHAAWNNQADVAEALIQTIPRGPERKDFVNAENKYHHTALHLAKVFKKVEAIHVLLSHGAH